jgi:hypothetical protein
LSAGLVFSSHGKLCAAIEWVLSEIATKILQSVLSSGWRDWNGFLRTMVTTIHDLNIRWSSFPRLLLGTEMLYLHKTSSISGRRSPPPRLCAVDRRCQWSMNEFFDVIEFWSKLVDAREFTVLQPVFREWHRHYRQRTLDWFTEFHCGIGRFWIETRKVPANFLYWKSEL